MIARQQLFQLTAELVRRAVHAYRRLPYWNELVQFVQDRLASGLGAPSAQPVEIDPDSPLPTEPIRNCYRALVWDHQVLVDEYNQQVEQSSDRIRFLRARLSRLGDRIARLARRLELLEPRRQEAVWVYYDGVDSASRIDWQNTSAVVDLANGIARCAFRAETTLELSVEKAAKTQTGLAWLLEKPITLNALYLDSELPIQVEVWLANTDSQRYIQVAKSPVFGGRLIGFDMQEADTIELRFSSARTGASALRRVAVARLQYEQRNLYRTARIPLEPSQWRAERVVGEIRVETLGTVPSGCSLRPKLIVWPTEDSSHVSPSGQVYLLSLREQSYTPDWGAQELDTMGMWYLPFPGVPKDAMCRLYFGERQYLFRILPDTPTLSLSDRVEIPPPDRTALDLPQAWYPGDVNDAVLYAFNRRYGIASAGTAFRAVPVLRTQWSDRIWYGCVVGVVASLDVANPLSTDRIPGLLASSDLAIRMWVRISTERTPQIELAAVSGIDRFPAAVSVWWNGTLLGGLPAGTQDDPVTAFRPPSYAEWNLLELVIRNGEAASGITTPKVVLWRVDSAVDYGILPGPLVRGTPAGLLATSASGVPQRWYPVWDGGANRLIAVLPSMPTIQKVGPFQPCRPAVRLVTTGVVQPPRYVQVEVELLSNGTETPVLDGIRLTAR